MRTGKVAGEGTLVAEFAEAHAAVTVRVRCAKRYLCFEIQSVDGPAVEEVSLLNLVLKTDQANAMSGVAADAEFAVALRALNLQTLGTVGGKPAWLSAAASRRHGLAGAKVGLAAGPVAEIRQVLKEMLEEEGATRSPLGGPWALDAERNRGSYVFADVSEKNVDDWIALAKLGGIQQIHFIGWEQTLGHYAPRKDAFPHGLAGLKAAVDKIHAAGLKAGMHTLTGAISPGDPWASPVPDPRLAKDATFTLAESIDGKSTALRTTEKPGDLDSIWAYSGRGNVLQVGDELIQYDAIARTSPYGFTRLPSGRLRHEGPAARARDPGPSPFRPLPDVPARRGLDPGRRRGRGDREGVQYVRIRHDLPGRFRGDGGRLVRHGQDARGDLQETRPRRPGGGQRLGPLRVGLSFPFRCLGLSQLGTQALRRRPLPGERGFSPDGASARTARLVGHLRDPSATIRRKRPTSSSISVASRWPTTRRPRSREFRWAASRPTRDRMNTWPCWAATNG